jgi:predicted MFS family arabinose efflux permease
MSRVSGEVPGYGYAILAAVALSALGAMFYNLLPLFVGTAQDYRGFDDESTGLISSVFFAGYTLTTSTAYFWIRRVNWRITSSLALVTACVTLLLAGYSRSMDLLVPCVFVAGGSFSVVYGIGATILGDTNNPARWYGLKISAEALLGAFLLVIFPGTLVAHFGLMGLMMGMVLTVLLLTPALRWLPVSGQKHPGQGVKSMVLTPQLRLAIWIALISVMFFIFSATMIWAFLERMAKSAGFEPVLVGNVLSLALICAVLGSMVAVVIGGRFGSGKPLIGATAMYLAAVFLLANGASLFLFAAGACLFTFSVGLGISYVVTIVANLDLDGRYVVLSVSAMGFGVMAAPAVGGLLTAVQGFTVVLMAGGLTVVVSLLAGLVALRTGGVGNQSAL